MAEGPSIYEIDEALREHLPLLSTWVLAAESCDPETGEPVLTVMHNGSSAWAKIGLVRVLSLDLESKVSSTED